MSTRQHRRLDRLTEKATSTENAGFTDVTVVQLLSEYSEREASPPETWRDREMLESWIEGLPDTHKVIILNIVSTPPEQRKFENEIRSPEVQ
jgi:hypothetical protein